VPNNVEALNNLGAAYVHNDEYIKGIECIYRAVKARDSKELAQNLVNAIAYAPERMRGHNSIKGAEDAARLLAGRYGIGGPTAGFAILPPVRGGPKASSDGTGGSNVPPDAKLSSGTGFIIADDGLILTNRHVVGNEKAELMVLLPGGEQKSAEIIKIDTEQDLALIRVKVDKKLPVAYMAAAELPGEGAQCFVLGYPLMDRMGSNIKITQGIVSGLQIHLKEADIVTDAKVNPGNSGGPMVNGQGHVMGIVTLKTYASMIEDSYGMAISSGRIRKFLNANEVKLPVPPAAAAGAAPMTAEQVAAKLKPATVCILCMQQGTKK
jgi:S1-C subfamily serine protease